MKRAFVLFGALPLIACSTVVRVPRMKPAEVDLAPYERVAVGLDPGPGSEAMAAQLTEALFETERFEVLDRQHLDRLLEEQDLSASGAISDESAISIGNMIGSAVLLVGSVSSQDYREDVSSKRGKCARDGKVVPCTRYTRTAKARVDVAIKALDTNTGKVLTIKNLSADRHRQVTGRDERPAPLGLEQTWLDECRREIADAFVKVIAPHEVQVKVKLEDDGDLPELERGNNFAKLGKWTRAAGEYRAALDRAQQNPDIGIDAQAKAHYNLGMALGLSGSYEAGIRQLEEAYGLEPEDQYREQIDRLRRFQADDQRLAEQNATSES